MDGRLRLAGWKAVACDNVDGKRGRNRPQVASHRIGDYAGRVVAGTRQTLLLALKN